MPVYVVVVRAVSAMVSIGFPVLEYRRDDTQGSGGGVAILALPRELATESRPLSGWDKFPVREPLAAVASQVVGEFPVVPGTVAGQDSDNCTVELFGQVIEAKKRVFCFLDRTGNRWFRMVEGSVDSEAGVTLLRAKDGDQPVLLDMRTGRKYRIDPGRHQLLPIDQPFCQDNEN